MNEPHQRTLEITERPEVPWLSIVLGYGPMLPFALGAAAAWILKGALRTEAIVLTTIWASAILAFLSGVRRGLSFRTEGGPAVAQIATMFCLFVLALAALIAGEHSFFAISAALLTVGFLAMILLDPIAAAQGQAPMFFARLRPPQLAIAVVSLAALFGSTVWHGS